MSGSWSLVLPVKGGNGKSRLALPDEDSRSALAIAFALDAIDAVTAAASVDRVIVVTSDVAVTRALLGTAVELVPDPEQGLNAAVRAGLALLDPGKPAGALLADLPALTPADLDGALELAAQHPLALVPDAEGSGTTLATALRADALVPRFGASSRAAHEAAGHVLLELPEASGLRRDVDNLDDLRMALALGVGRHTAAALAPRG